MRKGFKIIGVIIILIIVIFFGHVSTKKSIDKININDYFSELENIAGNNYGNILDIINSNLDNEELSSYERGLNLLGKFKYNYQSNNINEALNEFDKIKDYLEKHKMRKALLELYSLISAYYTGLEKYDIAYIYIYQGEKLATEIYVEERDKESLSELLSIMYLKAVVAMDIGMEEEAELAFLKAQQIEYENIIVERVDINYSKLLYYHKKEEYNKVKEYSKKLLHIIERDKVIKEYFDVYINANILLAESYLEERNIEECNNIVATIDEYKENLKKSIQSKLHILKSKIYIYNNDMDNAVISLEKAYYVIQDYNLTIREVQIIDDIVGIYENKNDNYNSLIWSERFRKSLHEIDKIAEYQYLLSSIINTDLLVANYNVELLELKTKNLQYVIIIIILIIIITLKKIFSTIKKKNIRNKILNSKLDLLNSQLIYQYNHYESIKEHQLIVKRICHDIRNHHIILFGLLDKGNCKEALLYLGDVNKELILSETKSISNNNIIDAIFSNKIKVCKDKKIDLVLDIKIPEELKIENFDLCVIFGNLLDNSIEACEKIDGEKIKKYIKIISFIKNEHLYIEIENSSISEIRKKGNIFITTKKDKEFHGLGLEAIRNTVKKYNGIIRIISEENKFSVSMVLKNQIV